MVSEETKSSIAAAGAAELEAAIKEYGEFHNHHEAWAVLQEEIDEVVDCSAAFGNTAAEMMGAMWELVKLDGLPEEEKEKNPLWHIFERAMELAEECIQVAAMCEKWQRLIVEERKNA